MSEQELKSLMDAIGRHNDNSKKALQILEEVVFKLHNEPQAIAILWELRRMLQMMENIHQARVDRMPQVRHL